MRRKKEVRLLPGDFAKRVKYSKVDNTPKDIEQPRAPKFFQFPEDLQGELFENRDFLVFYFDDKEDYKQVLNYFQRRRGNVSLSHPDLDSSKLTDLVRKATEGGEKNVNP